MATNISRTEFRCPSEIWDQVTEAADKLLGPRSVNAFIIIALREKLARDKAIHKLAKALAGELAAMEESESTIMECEGELPDWYPIRINRMKRALAEYHKAMDA